MKTNLLIQSASKRKIDLLLQVAKEMGILIEKISPTDEATAVSEPSLAEAWNSKEDDRWDELYGETKLVNDV